MQFQTHHINPLYYIMGCGDRDNVNGRIIIIENVIYVVYACTDKSYVQTHVNPLYNILWDAGIGIMSTGVLK